MLSVYKQQKTFLLRRVILLIAVAVVAFTSVAAILMVTRSNSQYADAASCGDVFDPFPSWLNTRLNENRSVYIQVANERGVPWEVLASLHYREFNMAVSNPNNGQGIYQLYSSGAYFPPGAVSRDEFIHQTRLAADFLQTKAQTVPRTSVISPRRLTTNDGDINLIKSALFSYNGRASIYAQQAATYGYSSSTQAFEGSPYVMNKFDCARNSMGLITNDGGNSLNGTDTRMGAFTLYARIKGEAYWNGLQIGTIPGCAEATGTTVSCIWRLYNAGANNYTYTGSYDERNRLIAMGYLYQNTAFYGRNPAASPLPGQIPVYQLKTGSGGSFLTVNQNEYAALKGAGWTDQGIAFYANPAGANTGYTVWRLYNSSTGAHLWTADGNEFSRLLGQGYSDEGIAFNQISPHAQESPAPQGQKVVYRFGSMPENRHFWTTDLYERDSMIRAGYTYEGVAWRASITPTSKPVYRLYSNSMKKHLFTTDSYERDVLDSTASWDSEGVAWYANPSSLGSPVYRLYGAYNAEHLFTTDSYERDVLSQKGLFRYEGVAWNQP